MSKFHSLGLVVALVGATTSSQAALATFTGITTNTGVFSSPQNIVIGGPAAAAQTSFLASVTSVGTENFDGKPLGDGQPDLSLSATFTGSTGPVTASLIGENRFVVDDATGNSAGRFDTTRAGATASDRKFLEVEDALTINFSTAINAFGFYATDFGEFANKLSVTLYLADGTPVTEELSITGSESDGSLVFWGFVQSDPTISYSAIKIVGSSSDDFFGIDDMMVGNFKPGTPSDVPEPITALLALAALAAAGAVRRARR